MYTPIKRPPVNAVNEMAFQTPQAQLSFSRELRQVLQERNLLTVKSRKKVCSMLNGSDYSTIHIGTPNPEVDKRRSFRLQAIGEILSSEKAYLSQLEMLMQFFVRPLKERAIIDNASHSSLFGQIEMIYNLNGEFLRELECKMEHVAQAFLKMAPFFKLYSVYAFDYRSALLVLQDLTSKNPVFRKFLEQTETRPEVQRKLNSLMIVPIQRVPRYKLLLEQVLLYTSPADVDFKLLKESVKQIESTVSHINTCIEDQEVTQLLIHLQNSLVNRNPNIVKPSRKVIKEGVLQKVTRNGDEIKRYCVLMSDIFMYCKILKDRPPNTVVENSLECCCIFPLKKCKVYELFPGSFKVACQGDGIILRTTDLQLSRIWVSFIRDAIDLHIQCRQTLRKESSKRRPIRKKDIKNFDTDYILSPTKKKCDYETIFRNKNRSTDSEDEPENDPINSGSTCFPRKKSVTSKQITVPQINAINVPLGAKSLKRSAPPPPPTPCPKLFEVENSNSVVSANRISKLYKYIASDKTRARGILKSNPSTTTASEYDPNYGFDTKSYFRAHNVDNTIPTAANREDLFADGLGDGNFRDALFPLRSSGGSSKCCNSDSQNWSAPAHKDNRIYISPPLKKRVKFDEPRSIVCANPPIVSSMHGKVKQEAFAYSGETIATSSSTKMSMRDKIYEFFASLF